MSDKLDFNWHWDHQQGAVFLKKDEIYAHRKNLAEFFYQAGHASRDVEVAVLKERLWAAEGRVKGMVEGLEFIGTLIDPRTVRFSEDVGGEVYGGFADIKSVSAYAFEILKGEK